jgi:hypothetical protein
MYVGRAALRTLDVRAPPGTLDYLVYCKYFNDSIQIFQRIRLQIFQRVTFWCSRVDSAPKWEVLCLFSSIWWEAYCVKLYILWVYEYRHQYWYKACTQEVRVRFPAGPRFFSALCLEFGVNSASWGQLSSYFNRVATSAGITSRRDER